MSSWSDSFNRANETPLASPWGLTGSTNPHLAGNLVDNTSDGSDAEMYYSTASGVVTDDQFSEAVIAAADGSGDTGAGVMCRHTGTSTRTFIRAICDSGGVIVVRTFSDGSTTLIGSRSGTFSAGDTLRMEVSGASPNIVIKLFINGTQVGADFTGVTGPDTGIPGLAYSSTGTAQWDDWAGGDLASGVTYNDSGSGTLTLSGSRTESASRDGSGTGTLTFSGSGSESATHTASASGSIVLSGTASESYTTGSTYNDSGVGSIVLSGAGSESASHTASASGSITFSGSRVESHIHASSSAGTFTLSGTGTESRAFADTRAGTITLSGASSQSYIHTGSGTGTVTFSGSAVENYAPPSSGEVTTGDEYTLRYIVIHS